MEEYILDTTSPSKKPTRLYACTLCDEELKSISELRLHASKHDIEMYVNIDDCGEVVVQNTDVNHILGKKRTISGRRLRQRTVKVKEQIMCKICYKCFRFPCHLRKHEKTHLKPPKVKVITGIKPKKQTSPSKEHKPYTCSTCGREFERQSSLTNHMKVHSREETIQIDPLNSIINSEATCYKCKTCGKPFRHRDSHYKHEKLHCAMSRVFSEADAGNKAFKCDVCSKGFRYKVQLHVHMNVHNPMRKIYRCDICPTTFTTSSSLKYHYWSHSGEKPFECKICGKCYRKNHTLKLHMNTHTGNMPHTCMVCGKGFSTKAELRFHTVNHTGIYPLQCDLCGKGFRKRQFLTTHLTHCSTDVPRQKNGRRVLSFYPCSHCDRVFQFKSCWEQHQSAHTGIYDFKCNICDRGFISRKSFMCHFKRHTKSLEENGTTDLESICNVCGKKYKKPYQLRLHFRIHTGDLPFACQYCDQRFNLKVTMQRHVAAIHTKIYPLNCDYCDRGFCSSDKLRTHIRVHHPEEYYNNQDK